MHNRTKRHLTCGTSMLHVQQLHKTKKNALRNRSQHCRDPSVRYDHSPGDNISIIGIYINKIFNQKEVNSKMIGHYIGKLSPTHKPVTRLQIPFAWWQSKPVQCLIISLVSAYELQLEALLCLRNVKSQPLKRSFISAIMLIFTFF